MRIEIQGTPYNFSAAWFELTDHERNRTLEDLQLKPIDRAAGPQDATADFPWSVDSFWRAAPASRFLNLAYQTGRGEVAPSEWGGEWEDPAYGDQRLRTGIYPGGDVHQYRQEVYREAVKFLRSKSGIPMWAIGAGAAALAFILFRR